MLAKDAGTHSHLPKQTEAIFNILYQIQMLLILCINRLT